MDRYFILNFQLVYSLSNDVDNSIPRPEVVKRVRPDNKHSQSPKPADTLPSQPDTIKSHVPPHLSELRLSTKDDSAAGHSPRSRYHSPAGARDSPFPQASPSGLGKELPHSPRHRSGEERPRPDAPPTMLPPSVPSQTPSAQELRETAKQSIGRSDKLDAIRHSSNSAAPSPRRRSPSPSSRPGTRNPSVESRASGGRSRSDRGNTDPDRDERRGDRESRQDSRDHAATLGRRDSITHNRSERSGRERTSTRDSDKDRDSEREKDRDRGRDRHGDREKDRDRDRDRERERDRDRDRHRRDDKDRDRDSRKDRDLGRGQAAPLNAPEERQLPTRPDPGRHRSQVEDGLGKRRRPADDDVSTHRFTLSSLLLTASFSLNEVPRGVHAKKGIAMSEAVGPPRKMDTNDLVNPKGGGKIVKGLLITSLDCHRLLQIRCLFSTHLSLLYSPPHSSETNGYLRTAFRLRQPRHNHPVLPEPCHPAN